jgi:hypothetical protein
MKIGGLPAGPVSLVAEAEVAHQLLVEDRHFTIERENILIDPAITMEGRADERRRHRNQREGNQPRDEHRAAVNQLCFRQLLCSRC